MSEWTQAEAVELCIAIEEVSPRFGFHVALTGGCLYKGGARKDCDVLLYRIRQERMTANAGALLQELVGIGLEVLHDYGWCIKAKWRGKSVDIFQPEVDEGDYPGTGRIEVELA